MSYLNAILSEKQGEGEADQVPASGLQGKEEGGVPQLARDEKVKK